MIRALIISLALLFALPLYAQEDDRGRIVQLIEGALSDGAARQVRIEGFQGALSSTATLDLLTISDADGVWLTIEDAELTWTRSALLRGALEVDRLAAARIVLDRLPMGEPAPTAPEATAFQLPELPVSIALNDLAIDRIELGAPLLGFPVTATLAGSANLVGGDGRAELMLDRLDGPEGRFALSAGFENETSHLDLSLTLAEAPGGIAVTLLGIPNDPSVNLELAGAGPLDDLTIDLALVTDGEPRVSGTLVSARDADGTHRISTALTGDITHLVLPEYQGFFGSQTGLNAVLTRPADGGTVLDSFALTSQSLSLEGTAALASDNTPLRFQVAGLISNASGGPVRLPIPGAPVSLTDMHLTLGYDRASGNGWTGETRISDLQAGDFGMDRADLTLSGIITPPDTGTFAVTADLLAALEGMRHTNPDLQAALGRAARMSLRADWQQGASLNLSRINMTGDTATLLGAIRFQTGDNALMAEIDLRGALPDLSAFSGLAGQDIDGAARMTLLAEADLLSGAFDATADLTAQDLRAGDAIPPALIAGETRIETTLRRNGEGLHLDRFDLTGTALTASAEGRLSSGTSVLNTTARLANAGLLTSAISGPVDASLTLTRANDTMPWTLSGDARGQGGLATEVSGQIGLPGGAVDLALSGTLPLALADQFITPRSVRGTARFDLTLTGPPALSSLGGTLTTSGARVSLPSLAMVLEGLDLSANITGSRLSLRGSSGIQPGGQLGFDGSLDLTARGLPGRIAVTLTRVQITEEDLFQTVIDTAAITVEGAMTGGPHISGEIRLGETNVLLDDLSFGSSEPIPEITHVGASGAQYATRDRAGLIDTGGGGAGAPVTLDLTIAAPSRIFLRGSGLDAELGGTIRLGGSSAAVAPSGQFELIRGRLSFLGQRFDISEATASLQGSFDPYLRVVAGTQTGDVTALITIEGPASAPELIISSVPDLPQDEILARLFFGRSATSLSPVQALQLVDAVSGVAGGQGLIGGLRDQLGIDDLDLSTDSEGNASLRVGRYISDNIYTDAEIGADGEAEISLNLDLTPNITARGGFSTDGDSSIGVFFERDY
ncbi:translocation/assembly module TamB domain-containing protein [Nioella aestuarii]|uniref:translocation/assembly module TamB domain-containing protein n=1 Tax=Nioella aestuarii TaxID=1662864 RepID=UPI003D7FE145